MKTIVWFGIVLGALSASGEVIIAKQGQRVTLKCGVNTYSNNLQWKHGDDLILYHTNNRGLIAKQTGTGPTALRSKEKREINLEISGVVEVDAGKFTCVADGKRHDHTLLVVSVRASPSAEPQLGSRVELQLGSRVELQCQVKGLNPADSPVKWKSPDGREHAGSVLDSVARSDAGIWNCTFSHDGVTYKQSLEIKVKEPETSAPSKSGDDNKPNCPNCDSPSSPGNTQPKALLGLVWWVWVAIGVGCLVVFLLMVFVIVMCKRIKRRKRKFQTMKNGRQPLKKYCQCARPAAAAKPQQGRRREKPSAHPLQPLLME